jgi:hypothetical protein
MATMTMPRPGRDKVIRAMASKIDGMAMMPSMARIMTASIRLK